MFFSSSSQTIFNGWLISSIISSDTSLILVNNCYYNYDKECSDCGRPICCHLNRGCLGSKDAYHSVSHEDGHGTIGDTTSSSASSKNNSLDDMIKTQLWQYFLDKGIESIELKGENLLIKYKNQSDKQELSADSLELQQIKKFIENKAENSLNFSELATAGKVNETPSKNNHYLAIGLTAGGIILVSGVILLLIRKKISKKKHKI